MDIEQIERIVKEGATYAGHPFHIVLNYTLLLLVIIPNLFGNKQNTPAWLVVLVLFTIIQVSFWFTMNAVGISLIWCALAGYNALTFFRHRKDGWVTVVLLLFSPLAALAGIVFYAIYFPPLTTVAHSISFLLGIVLGYRFRRAFIRRKSRLPAFKLK